MSHNIHDNDKQIPLKVLAEVYRLGLVIGFFDKDYVIQWVDKTIEDLSHPPIELIEVSMKVNAPPVDVASALSEIKGDFESEGVAIQFILGTLSQMLRKSQNYEDVVEYLWRLSNEALVEHFLGSSIYWKMNTIESEYIHGDQRLVRNEVDKFLEPYSTYTRPHASLEFLLTRDRV